MANQNYQNVVTPSGVAIYPHLINPDTKFNPIGEYKVSLSLVEDEATPIIEKINVALEQAKEMIPEGKKAKEAELPYFIEKDEDGNQTNRYVFKFKMKAKINTKDGRTIEMSPKIFDSQGKLIKGLDSIWGGSTLRVSADLVPFYVAAVGAGVTLRLKAVQVIELVKGGGSDGSSFGFDKTDGYVAEEQESSELVFADEEDF